MTRPNQPAQVNQAGQAYWRSLDELADSPQFRRFVESEFPTYAPQLLTSPSRRQFLKVMGASLALAGMTGCRRWPRRQLAPYANRPDSAVPGQFEYFATAMELGGVARPLLVTAVDERPVKIEGNPDHPASRGAADTFAQASILDLYNPHRSRTPMQGRLGKARTATWQQFNAWWKDRAAELSENGGRGLVVLSELTSSPTVQRLQKQLLEKFSQAKLLHWQPINEDNAIAGTQQCFGRSLRPVYYLDRADVIVSLDSNFLAMHADALRLARQFAERRRQVDTDQSMNRLYVAEPTWTITGAAADERLAASTAEIQRQLADSSDWFGTAMADLKAHRGRGLILAGPDMPPAVHAFCCQLNHQLGNVGQTVEYIDQALPQCIRELPADIDTLVILGGNPVYDAPFAVEAQHIVHLGFDYNETAYAADWHLPRAHYLEAWGDCRAWDGSITIQQPLIRPLFGGRSVVELLSLMIGDEADGYAQVRRTHRESADEKQWRRAVHDGLIVGSAALVVSTTPRGDAAPPTPVESDAGGLGLLVRPSSSMYDGRFADNGWLQELPDPITSITWDNAALLSPTTAAAQKLHTGDVVRIGDVDVPVYVLPGQADNCVAIAMGYGRRIVGPVGREVGVNAFALPPRVTLEPTGRRHELAMTQDHHAIDLVGLRERQQRAFGNLVRTASLDEFRRHPEFAHHIGPHVPRGPDGHPPQQWVPPIDFDESSEYQWGMAIDLTSCIGCNACMIACQAENNVPVVGRDEVANGREMHWIRLDRYFGGTLGPDGQPQYNDPSSVRVVHQPIVCQHCENAPCEQVCPVAATVHDSEGLNVMVYNRCIGTRYCSNNCPYKVRRFNYFDYQSKDPRADAQPFLGMPDAQQQAQIDPLRRMRFNPQVTVRMRGVMEKCTFCTQRIEAAKVAAKLEDRPVRDGEVTPACAQTCPTQAIVFGNLKDPDSRVRQLSEKNHRAYVILNELNTRPRVSYLAQVDNPNRPSGSAPGHPAEPHTTDNEHDG